MLLLLLVLAVMNGQILSARTYINPNSALRRTGNWDFVQDGNMFARVKTVLCLFIQFLKQRLGRGKKRELKEGFGNVNIFGGI